MSERLQYERFSRCGIDNCRTHLYYLQDGQWFCKNGHRREGELDIDEDEFTAGVTGNRAKKLTEEREKITKVLTGRKASLLYLKCLQLILRKQLYILVHQKGFPKELEVVIRDLWTLRLQKFLERHRKAHVAAVQELESILQDVTDEDSGEFTDTGYYSSDYFTSDVEVDHAISGEVDPIKRRVLARQKKQFKAPGLLMAVALCYLGALMLRVPVSLGDLHRWIDTQEIPYTHAFQEIPREMSIQLPGIYIMALKPMVRVDPHRLQKTVTDLVYLYNSQFGVTFPEINWPILAMKYVRDLGLPLEIYIGVKELTKILNLAFTYEGKPRVQTKASDLPEAKLMSLVIISSKLAWGLDGVDRTPRDQVEPAAMVIDQKRWERFLAEVKFKGDSLFDYNDIDILNMSGEEVDVYLDWYEKTWLNTNTKTKKQHPEFILSMFPVGQSSNESEAVRAMSNQISHLKKQIQQLHSNFELKAPKHTVHEAVVSPGQRYPFWKARSTLPPHAKMLFDAASAAICMSKEDLVVCTRQTEMMLRNSEWSKHMRSKGNKN